MAGKPGRGGPPPKRSTQRRRRNKPDVEIESAVSDGTTRGPDLKGQHRAVSVRWYEALRTSGQAQFYEDSDWATAELVVLAMDAFVDKPTAGMLASIMQAQSALLTTEGERRRARLELERASADAPEEADGDVSELDEYRERLRGAV